MGSRGPVPKRSEERIRRNKDEAGPVEKIVAIGRVEIPELGLEDPHPMIVDFYESLKDSAQSQYYEPSDWEYARITMHFLDGLVRRSGPSAQMLATVATMLSGLLVTEGDRRRVRLEVEREQSKQQMADVAEMFRNRLAQ